jgi:hypothetical protein
MKRNDYMVDIIDWYWDECEEDYMHAVIMVNNDIYCVYIEKVDGKWKLLRDYYMNGGNLWLFERDEHKAIENFVLNHPKLRLALLFGDSHGI